VDSKGSTSKSYFIRLLSYKFINIVGNLLKPIVIPALISVVANNIDSYTIYSLFKLLFGIRILNCFNKFRKYKYFIINEKSILGIRNICFINKRLR
ncbi:hypothetical protein GE21DRAFT_1222863, partial [Neurospora crassa]